MKFLIVTLGSIGDLLPFLAIADALRHRGHQVVVASNAGYATLVRASGFEFAAIWERSHQSLDGVIAQDPQRAWAMVRKEMLVPAEGPVRDFIARHAQGGPCVVLASWTAFGARLAHDELGVPLCTAYLSPGARQEDSGFRAARNGCRNIGLFPDWFGDSFADVDPVGFAMPPDALLPALPQELEHFLRQGSPPVVFTPGSFMRQAEPFFRESLAVCERLDLRAIFLTPYLEQVPTRLPAGVMYFKYVSLQRLAPRSAALVHHGGIGTCAQGLRAGIPQLVTPLFFDQPYNGACLAALGVGEIIPPNSYSAGQVATKLSALLGSHSVRQDCARISALFDGADAVRDVCTIVETMA